MFGQNLQGQKLPTPRVGVPALERAGHQILRKDGAKNQSEQWRNYRLDGENLSKLAL